MSTPNWARLVSQGRAKAHGISWSDAEMRSLVEIEADMPRELAAEFVRRGATTLDEALKLKESDAKSVKKPVDAMNREELVAEAKAEGNSVTPEAPTSAIRDVVKRKKSGK